MVAGVLILDAILLAVESRLGQSASVAHLPLVKFVSPLRPGQQALLELVFGEARVDFTVSRGPVAIAKGHLVVEVPPTRG